MQEVVGVFLCPSFHFSYPWQSLSVPQLLLSLTVCLNGMAYKWMNISSQSIWWLCFQLMYGSYTRCNVALSWSDVMHCSVVQHFERKLSMRRSLYSSNQMTWIYSCCSIKGLVYTNTDVEEVHLWMVKHFTDHPLFVRVPEDELVGLRLDEILRFPNCCISFPTLSVYLWFGLWMHLSAPFLPIGTEFLFFFLVTGRWHHHQSPGHMHRGGEKSTAQRWKELSSSLPSSGQSELRTKTSHGHS